MNPINDYVYPILGAIAVFVTGLWKLFSISEHHHLITQRVTELEKDILLLKQEINSIETKIFENLNRIEAKIDSFILSGIKK